RSFYHPGDSSGNNNGESDYSYLMRNEFSEGRDYYSGENQNEDYGYTHGKSLERRGGNS
ncbi:unnamed protein product, partial [marine sediment metagenome]